MLDTLMFIFLFSYVFCIYFEKFFIDHRDKDGEVLTVHPFNVLEYMMAALQVKKEIKVAQEQIVLALRNINNTLQTKKQTYIVEGKDEVNDQTDPV